MASRPHPPRPSSLILLDLNQSASPKEPPTHAFPDASTPSSRLPLPPVNKLVWQACLAKCASQAGFFRSLHLSRLHLAGLLAGPLGVTALLQTQVPDGARTTPRGSHLVWRVHHCVAFWPLSVILNEPWHLRVSLPRFCRLRIPCSPVVSAESSDCPRLRCTAPG